MVKHNGIILIGDILLPGSRKEPLVKKKILQKPWWPSALNHQLTKLKIEPTFFKNYCRQKNLKCEILEQHIPGRVIPEKRYDVRITVKKNE